MKNIAIREKIREHRLHNYEVAAVLGVSEFTFSRWLRDELETEKRDRILLAVEKLTATDEGKGADDHD